MKPLAIRLKKVSKIYKLHNSQWDMLVEVLRLQRFGFKTKSTVKDFPALSNVSLEIHTGQRIGIIGRNGAGKTTAMRCLLGLSYTDSGNMFIEEKEVSKKNFKLRNKISYLAGDFRPYENNYIIIIMSCF